MPIYSRTRDGRDVVRPGPPRALDAEAGLARVPQPRWSLLRRPIQCPDFSALPVLPEDPR